jgi:alpha-tubulin suppressor-like RCC1 family protein
LSTRHTVFRLGLAEPLKLPEITQIAVADFHALFLTTQGKILHYQDENLSEIPIAHTITQIAAGNSNYAINKESDLYVWGQYQNKQIPYP